MAVRFLPDEAPHFRIFIIKKEKMETFNKLKYCIGNKPRTKKNIEFVLKANNEKVRWKDETENVFFISRIIKCPKICFFFANSKQKEMEKQFSFRSSQTFFLFFPKCVMSSFSCVIFCASNIFSLSTVKMRKKNIFDIQSNFLMFSLWMEKFSLLEKCQFTCF